MYNLTSCLKEKRERERELWGSEREKKKEIWRQATKWRHKVTCLEDGGREGEREIVERERERKKKNGEEGELKDRVCAS